MAYSEADRDALMARLGAMPGLSERRMFGALCVMLHGNMLCGVRDGGVMIRVGKPNMGDALALDGVEPAEMGGGRRMAGFVEVNSAALAYDDVIAPLLDLAFRFCRSLPPK